MLHEVEVCIHRTKMWVGVELDANTHIAVWGATTETNWRRGPGETIGDGFKGVQASTVSGSMFAKAREKERKGYTKAYTLDLADLFTAKNVPQTATGRKFLELIREHAQDAGLDPKLFTQVRPVSTPNRVLQVTEPIKGSTSAVPWA